MREYQKTCWARVVKGIILPFKYIIIVKFTNLDINVKIAK